MHFLHNVLLLQTMNFPQGPGLFDRPSRINAIASSLVGSITYPFFPFPYALIKTNAENPHEYTVIQEQPKNFAECFIIDYTSIEVIKHTEQEQIHRSLFQGLQTSQQMVYCTAEPFSSP